MLELVLTLSSVLSPIVVTLGIWQIQRMINKSEAKRTEQERCREEYQFISLRYTQAAVKLGKASARFIVNGKTNPSDVAEALKYAQEVEAEQEKWLQKQGIKQVI